jgi:hypothetical protein
VYVSYVIHHCVNVVSARAAARVFLSSLLHDCIATPTAQRHGPGSRG